MSDIWAVIPVKEFDDAKHRLSGLLSPLERRLLAETMLTDMLDAVAGSRYLAGAGGWNVAGHRDHAATPFACEKPAAGVHAAGVSAPRTLGHDPRTDLFAKGRRMRIERDDRHAGQKP